MEKLEERLGRAKCMEMDIRKFSDSQYLVRVSDETLSMMHRDDIREGNVEVCHDFLVPKLVK